MTNAERFKQVFGLYATELWEKSEKEFLEWLNTNASNYDMMRNATDEELESVYKFINCVATETNVDFFKSIERHRGDNNEKNGISTQ